MKPEIDEWLEQLQEGLDECMEAIQIQEDLGNNATAQKMKDQPSDALKVIHRSAVILKPDVIVSQGNAKKL
jgi:hypothetical protein